MAVIYQIEADNPIRFLPMVYLLPYDLLVRCPTLRKLPRKMGELRADPASVESIRSDAFLLEILDAVALMVFPFFGFRGYKEHYTGWFPVWRLCYALPLWADGVDRVRGWNIQTLLNLPPDYEIPFFEPADVQAVMKQVVQLTIKEQHWQSLLDAVREMPCEEDFEPWNTNVRKDFFRKWYHTRSKKLQIVSLEENLGNEHSSIYAIADPAENFVEQTEAADFCQKFKATLSEKDMAILELRMQGFAYREIANKLGYKNHSGVIKRMEMIKKRFCEYEEAQL